MCRRRVGFWVCHNALRVESRQLPGGAAAVAWGMGGHGWGQANAKVAADRWAAPHPRNTQPIACTNY